MWEACLLTEPSPFFCPFTQCHLRRHGGPLLMLKGSESRVEPALFGG